jgi:hypothetical protein
MKLKLTALLITPALASFAAFAADGYTQRAGGATWPSWDEMHREVASARSLLDGELTAGLDAVGQVDDLVLDEDASTVRYIVADIPYPQSRADGPNGIVSFREVDVREAGDGAAVIAVAEASGEPGRLVLELEDAENRLASRMLGSELRFSGEDTLPVKDFLIDRNSGEITHWIVATERGLLGAERRAVPADRVSFAQGTASARVTIGDLDALQEFNPAYL